MGEFLKPLYKPGDFIRVQKSQRQGLGNKHTNKGELMLTCKRNYAKIIL